MLIYHALVVHDSDSLLDIDYMLSSQIINGENMLQTVDERFKVNPLFYKVLHIVLKLNIHINENCFPAQQLEMYININILFWREKKTDTSKNISWKNRLSFLPDSLTWVQW